MFLIPVLLAWPMFHPVRRLFERTYPRTHQQRMCGIEHGPPGPRLQFVPVRTAPIVGLRLGNPIETFSRHTDSAADFVGAERAMEGFYGRAFRGRKAIVGRRAFNAG